MNFFDFENLKNEHLKSLEFHSHKRAKAVIKDSLYNCSVIISNYDRRFELDFRSFMYLKQ